MNTQTETPASCELDRGNKSGCNMHKTRSKRIPLIPGVDKWIVYESQKRMLQMAGLTPGEYEIQVISLAKLLDI